jgi:hypothetical protein
MRGGEDRSWSDPEGMTMENEILITAIFVSAGLLAYVIIPGMLVIWDRVLDHMEDSKGNKP